MTNLTRVFVGAALAFAGGPLLVEHGPAFAQSTSTIGSLRGVLRDKQTGEPAGGATVVATSPALVGEQVVLTDESGQYFITALPPGTYTLTIYYGDKPFSRPDVLIQVGKESVVNISLDVTLGARPGETIELSGAPPIVDQGSTKVGVTITDDFTRNIPVGRTFGAVLGSAAGAQADTYGTSFAGATSAENVYVVEGINTTDTGFGGLSSNLPNEFIAETEVIGGGYNAEFGRATGGIVNVVTKQGSNRLRGSVFGYVLPGALVSESRVIAREGSSIDDQTNLDYAWDVGAELGGPILKDKLWFHVGFNPSTTRQTVTRIIQSQVDADHDGVPDVDPGSGFGLRDRLAERANTTQTTTYFYTAKLNGAIDQNHQFQVSAFGNPRQGNLPLTVVRNPAYRTLDAYDGAYDLAAKWTSKFNEGKTQVDAVLGFHRQINNRTPVAGQDVPLAQYTYTRSLFDFADLEGAQTIAACDDSSPSDPYPMIQNCPVLNYASQGMGFLESRTNDRTSLIVAATQRVKAAGYHTFKAGIDADLASYDSRRGFAGGTAMLRSANTAAGAPGRWQTQQHVRVLRNLTQDELQSPGDVMLEPGQILCADDRAVCQHAVDGIRADTRNRSIAAFLQDSWQLRPNLTINLGLRWEQQTGLVAEALQGQLTPQGETVPDVAYKLTHQLSPRVGFIYDPTREGRSKIFGHWGRFYENVPMDINVRAFGGEINNVSLLNFNRRTSDAQGYDPRCDVDHRAGVSDLSSVILQCGDRIQQALLGEGTEYVSPGLKGQYTDELIVGAEYQFVKDFKLGINYVRRTVPRVIEDISTDGGNSYLITNPGEDFSGAAADQRAAAARLMATGDPEDAALAALYLSRADQLDAVSRFERPIRNYDAIALTATQRPTRQSLLMASYTYSVAKGNYPGLFSTETDQLDPNLTSLYDLPDLMANRYGRLGLDRPHNLKIDGFYQFDLKQAGVLMAGASFRAQSGIAHNALGAHPVYGAGEAFLAPRGSFERSPLTSQFDLQLGYGYKLSKDTMLEGFVRVFNVLDQQEELDVDENYTFDNAIPVIGGDAADLRHVKALDDAGFETNQTVTPNRNFRGVSARQLPRSVQLGVRLTF